MTETQLDTRTERIYRLRVIGKLWLPACTAAKCVTLTGRDNRRYSEPFNLNDPSEEREFIERQLYLNHSGDFSEVTDWECERTLRTTQQTGDTRTTVEQFSTVKAWDSEDSELIYADCTAGEL
jgi:hypothetical protein